MGSYYKLYHGCNVGDFLKSFPVELREAIEAGDFQRACAACIKTGVYLAPKFYNEKATRWGIQQQENVWKYNQAAIAHSAQTDQLCLTYRITLSKELGDEINRRRAEWQKLFVVRGKEEKSYRQALCFKELYRRFRHSFRKVKNTA